MALEYKFTLPPPPTAIIVVLSVFIVILFVIVLLIAPIIFFSIRVSKEKISINAPPLNSYSFRRDEVGEVYIVDLSLNREYLPVMRTFGIGLPGWKVGWYKLENGGQAYLAITSTTGKVVVFKLRNGKYVILQPKDFNGFVEALKKLKWM